jgi:ABC-2 type transport system permease protein
MSPWALLVAHVEAAGGILRRDFMVFRSYRTQMIAEVASTFISLALFYFISRLLAPATLGGPTGYFAYVVVGILILQTLQSTLAISGAVRGELVAGTLERLLLSPFGAVAGILSMMIFPFVNATFSATLTLIIAVGMFGLHAHWSTVPLAIPVAMLGTGAFTSVGMYLAASTIIIKQVALGSGLILGAIGIVSGLYFPAALLPGSIRWLSSVQPFTPAVALLRHLLVGTPLVDPGRDLLKLVGFVVIMFPIGLFVLSLALRYGQHRGTITEY